ncbi:winged helix-turn-helix transcriptional regulator [Sphaerisporangium sp. TRM90804]|uniref:winged helix-turn-helix transcriptional regulator n=1 Tax=Sphaerisporangium sp. TRM90804 TaxID=3031113 RepID=UPI00244C394C|nr:winged helix-turn-helix transcriptional regulator [Sphaerisporangium sp. TRM90804]MDH2428084.1 winged helix-turn-helix transcriptional regulator [Sphaerisporangium sp. TRM90804]
MGRELRDRDLWCAIAQAAAVVGDWWSLLIVREVTRGHHRFEELLAELGVSRKVLSERLRHLVDHEVLERRPYQTGPTRHEYVLTPTGAALAPVLIAMQDWGDRWLLADGSLTGSAAPESAESARVHALLGTPIPSPLRLPATTPPTRVPAPSGAPTGDTVRSGGPGRDTDRSGAPGREDAISGAGLGGTPAEVDVVAAARATILFAYPATGIPGPLPPGWDTVPGAVGCTLENRLFRQAAPALAADGVAVRGVSTQRPDEQAVFARAEDIAFPLLSDMDLRLTAALRLPTFRIGQTLRMKRLILVTDASRVVRHVVYPVLDVATAVAEAADAAREVAR